MRFWSAIAAMVVVALAARAIMLNALAALHPISDARFATNYAAGATLPFPVVMDSDRGWTFLAIFFAFVVGLAAASWIAASALRSAGERAPTMLLGGAIVVVAAVTLFPVTFSLDAYAYVAFGRLIGIYGLNPYVDHLASAASQSDTRFGQLTAFFGTSLPGDNYGPLWNVLAATLAIVTNSGGLALSIWAQRAAAALALILTVAGLLRLQRMIPAGERAHRVALFALHPLALYESAGSGHNDVLMIAPAVWAFAIADTFPLVAGVLLGAAVAVKYVALLAVPFFGLRAYRRRGVAAAASVVIPSLAIPALLFTPMWPGWPALGSILALGTTLIVSPQWLVTTWLPALPAQAVTIVFAFAFAVVLIVALARYARDGCIYHVFRSITALIWSSPLLNPWYVQWLLPAAATGSRWARYAWWFGLFVLLRYVEDALRFPGTQAELAGRMMLLETVTVVILVVPVLLSAIEFRFQRSGVSDA